MSLPCPVRWANATSLYLMCYSRSDPKVSETNPRINVCTGCYKRLLCVQRTQSLAEAALEATSSSTTSTTGLKDSNSSSIAS